MSKLVIEKYSDIHKNEVADLILSIQTCEFGIPITLKEQPDLNEIPRFYQTNNGTFGLQKLEIK